jgi:hypothetical protein
MGALCRDDYDNVKKSEKRYRELLDKQFKEESGLICPPTEDMEKWAGTLLESSARPDPVTTPIEDIKPSPKYTVADVEDPVEFSGELPARVNERIKFLTQVPKPESLVMGGRKYKIDHDGDFDHTEDDYIGHTANNERLIRLRKHEKLNRSESAMTLLHEIFHVIIFSRSVSGLLANEDLEEALVDGLESGMSEIINRNPEVMRYLIQELTVEE